MKNSKTILVLEDDSELNLLIRNALEREGFQAQGVSSGAEAISVVKNRDILLMIIDYGLPDMSGSEVVSELKENNCFVPFVVLTGQGNEEIAVKMMKLGARDYILKDTNLFEILPLVIKKAVKEIEIEKELAFEKDKIVSIMNALPSGVTIRNLDYELIYQNDYITNTFGNHLGEKCFHAFQKKDDICDDCPVQMAFEDGKNHTVVKRVEGPAHEIDYWQKVAIPLRNMNGDIDSCIAINTNITDQKNMERAILEIEDKALKRIGQNLHDDMGQLLTGTAFKVQALRNNIKNKVLIETQDVDDIISLITMAKDRTRQLTSNLLSLGSSSDSLIEAIINLVDFTNATYDVMCEFNFDHDIPIQGEMKISHLYRIVQEALNNAVKHGNPRHIAINLFTHDDKIVLTIKDDGTGNADILNQSEGKGLQIIRYRADLIGASIHIDSDVHTGTSITCAVGDR